VYFLVYVSSATTLFSRSQLLDILSASRASNIALGVTGMLLYKGGNLMQVLEGERDAVQGLYAKIARDPRHQGLMTLLDGAQDERRFGDWSMAFCDLDAADAASVPGYSEFLNTPLTSAEFTADPALSQRLLTTFKQSM
jgi:hypothetical protein